MSHNIKVLVYLLWPTWFFKFFSRLNLAVKNYHFRCRLCQPQPQTISLGPGIISQGEENIKIGENFCALRNLRIDAINCHNGIKYSPKLTIGNNVVVQDNVHIGCINSVQIEDDVLIGSNVLITDHDHGNTSFSSLSCIPVQRKLYSKGEVVIGRKTWVCDGVVILGNVCIGESCVIAANSVVTKSFEPFSIIAGNPARCIKKVEHAY